MSQVEIGEIIDGKYRIDKIIGQGGMGSVVLATHTIRRAPVALKFLLPEIANVPSVVERFINEAVAASALDCDNVISVFDVGSREDAPYLVMEYLQGQDMEEALEQCGGRMDVGRAVHIVLQALRGLTAAHSKGIVHRDLKPANIFLITKEGELDFVKLLDFGVSKLTTPDRKALTSTGTGLGTPLYMSPEQARNAQGADGRADVYSMGAVLYQALAGQVPLDGNTMAELITKLITEEPVRLEQIRTDIPKQLADVVHRALAKDPAQRYQSAYEFASDLSAFADDRSMAVVSRIRATAPAFSTTGISTTAQSMVHSGGGHPMAATAQAFGGGKTGQGVDDQKGSRKGLVFGAVAAAVLLGGGAVFALSGGGTAETADAVTEEPVTAPAAAPEVKPETPPIVAVKPEPEPEKAAEPEEKKEDPAQAAKAASATAPNKTPTVAPQVQPPPKSRVTYKPKPAPRPKPATVVQQPKPQPRPAPTPTKRNPLEIGIK